MSREKERREGSAVQGDRGLGGGPQKGKGGAAAANGLLRNLLHAVPHSTSWRKPVLMLPLERVNTLAGKLLEL